MVSVYKKLISYAKEKKQLLFITIVFSVLAAVFQVSAFYYLFKLLEDLILLSDVSGAKRARRLLLRGLWHAGEFCISCP
jgi:ATP-binding cassette subfamily B protein IrtA